MPDSASSAKAAMTDWAVGILRSLTLNNILILALLAAVAIPSYASYKFLTDRDFRQEFMGGVTLINADVPCLVYTAVIGGGSERTYVFVGYRFEGRFERLVGVRTSQGTLTESQLPPACEGVVHEAQLLDKLENIREKQ